MKGDPIPAGQPGPSLAEMMPDAFPIFFSGRTPWPAQAAVMPSIVQGRSTLFAAPTASGKTEAAMAPLYQRHASFQRRRLSVVYVAPTKALANDIFERLDSYLGIRSPGIVARYTGDRHEFKRAEGLFCLVVTPEALDSLQLTRPDDLRGIRTVVVDEIHLLQGSPRGQQLRFVIDRIRAASSRPAHPKDAFQVVGMTATINRLSDVRDLWIGPDGALVRHGTPREIDLELLDIGGENRGEDMRAAAGARCLARRLSRDGARKVLVFGNSRNGTHAFAAALSGDIEAALGAKAPPVHMHIGVLSTTEREAVERAMKDERAGICVATSTLEIGIDIGNVDLIVLAAVPSSVGSFLQRIGRGNRRSGRCRVLALHAGPDEADLYRALLACGQIGDLDDLHEYDRPSVRFQQVLSLAWWAARHDDGLLLHEVATRTGGHDHEQVITDMLSTGVLQKTRGAVFPNDDLISEEDKRRIHSVIVGGGGQTVLDARSGDVVVQVEGRHQAGSRLFVGGRFRELRDAASGPMHLEASVGEPRGRLARLPKTRGSRGLSRSIVWALARQQGRDPRGWTWAGGRWTTHGGADLNRLLAALLDRRLATRIWRADDFGVDCSDPWMDRPVASMTDLGDLLDTVLLQPQTLTTVAQNFLQPSRYRRLLSNDLQLSESISSIPVGSFRRWIAQCHLYS